MSRVKQDFKRSERIKGRNLFSAIFKKGKYFKTTDFSLRLFPNNVNIVRLGISIQKAVFPKSVHRQRVKRLIREVFRRNKGNIRTGFDLVIKPGNKTLYGLKYKDYETKLLELLNIAGITKQE